MRWQWVSTLGASGRWQRPLAVAVLCWLAACSDARLEACGEARKLVSERSAAKRSTQHESAGATKPKPWRPPKREPGGTWRTLSFFLPDSIEGFRARMGRDGRDIDVGVAQPLLTVRRSYANKEGVILDLELIDTSASPRLRELFGRTRELARDNERAVFRALKVQGQRAFTQWLDASKSARTSVLIAERFLLNVDTKPVTTPAVGVGVAQKLDFPKLIELASSPVLPKLVLDAGVASAAVPGASPATAEAAPDSAPVAGPVEPAPPPSAAAAPASAEPETSAEESAAEPSAP